MKLLRIQSGVYQSRDGRVVIQRRLGQHSYRAKEVCWSICIDGKYLPFDENSKKDAVRQASKRLIEK